MGLHLSNEECRKTIGRQTCSCFVRS